MNKFFPFFLLGLAISGNDPYFCPQFIEHFKTISCNHIIYTENLVFNWATNSVVDRITQTKNLYLRKRDISDPAVREKTLKGIKMMEEIKFSSFTHLEMARAGIVAASALINTEGPKRNSCTLLTEGFALATKSSGLLKKVAALEERLGIITPGEKLELWESIDATVTDINKTGEFSKTACDTRFGI